MSINEFDKFGYLKRLHGAKMTGSQYRVLVTLLDYADADGSNAYPSVETLATDCDMTDRNVKRCLAWLRANGWIVQRKRGGRRENGVGWSSVYDISHGDIYGQSTGHSRSVMGTPTVSHGDTSVTRSDPQPDPESDPQPDHAQTDPYCQECEDADESVCLRHWHDRAHRYRAPELDCATSPRNPASGPPSIEAIKRCAVDECDETPMSTGYCPLHYGQFAALTNA